MLATTSKASHTAFQGRQARGFTLVELLVAMLLGALLLFGVTQIFDSTREGSRVQSAMASVQDGGRIAIEFISRDIRSADFSGCLRQKSELTSKIDLSSSNYAVDVHPYYDLGAVYGKSAEAGDTFGSTSPIVGTGVLRVVGARPYCDGVNGLALDQSSIDDPLTLTAACDIDDGTVLLVSNCSSGELFVKTGGTGAAIEHDDGVEVEGLKNTSDSFTTLYGRDATVNRPFVYTYFVALGENGNPALFRREDSVNFELIPNISDFQVLFGVDNDGSNVVNEFIAPTDGMDTSTVKAVRVSVEVQSVEEVNGSPISRTYTSTTNIRNRTVDSAIDV